MVEGDRSCNSDPLDQLLDSGPTTTCTTLRDFRTTPIYSMSLPDVKDPIYRLDGTYKIIFCNDTHFVAFQS